MELISSPMESSQSQRWSRLSNISPRMPRIEIVVPMSVNDEIEFQKTMMKPSILYVELKSLENSHLVLTSYLGNVERASIKPISHRFNYLCGNKYGSFEVQVISHLGVLKIRRHLVLHSARDEAEYR